MKYRRMTVGRLHKILGKLIEQGNARTPICVNKRTFRDNCEEDGVVILPVEDVVVDHILIHDGDGGTKYRKDGTECRHVTAVIVGASYDPSKRC